LNEVVFNAPDRRDIGSFIWEPTRHHEAIFDPHREATSAPATTGATGHRPRAGRWDTNELIDLYPKMAKDFAAKD
jgi:hypothetical protein